MSDNTHTQDEANDLSETLEEVYCAWQSANNHALELGGFGDLLSLALAFSEALAKVPRRARDTRRIGGR